MIKNVKIKIFLKETAFKPFNLINKIIPKEDKIILLYSGNLGIRHNLTPLKNEFINKKYTNHYKVICGIEKMCYAENEKDIIYVTHKKALFWFLRAKHVFYSAGQIPIKPSKSQIVIHMNHGTSDLKSMGAMTKINNGNEFYFTYMLVPSDIYVPIYAKAYQCPKENIKVCGEPMTDLLFIKENKYDLGHYKKIIFWLPTFRQSSFLNYNDSSEGIIPLFDNNDYDELNTILHQLDYKLIVKLHTAQNTEELIQKEYSNLKIYTNDEFIKNKFNLYELLKQADVLLGDYSSVSLQFLLLNKPIAFVVPDMEEYRRKRGFCFEHPEDYMPGPMIKTREQFFNYLINMPYFNDDYIKEREKVKNLIFKYQDGMNTQRVIEMSDIHI